MWNKNISIDNLLDGSYDKEDIKCNRDDDDWWKNLKNYSGEIEMNKR